MKLKIFIILFMCLTVTIFSQTTTSSPVDVEKRIASMESNMKEIREDFEKLSKEIEISKEFSKISNIVIGIFLGAIALFVTIMSFLFRSKNADFNRKIDSAEKELKSIKELKESLEQQKIESLKSALKSELNSEMAEQFKQIEKRFEELKNNIEKRFEEVKNNLFIVAGMQIDHLIKGNNELDKGNYELAELHFRMEISKKEQPQPNAWVGLAKTYWGLDRFEDALKAVERAIALDKDEPKFNVWGQISMLKVELLIDIERYQEARDVLMDEVLKLAPDSRKARNLLELCDNKLGNKKKK